MSPKRFVAGVCAYVVVGSFMSAVAPIDGTFNYQGRLTNSGAAVTGTADLKFRLYDDSAAGAQVGSEIELLAVSVAGGLFNVDLDFGVSSFNGDQRWLEIDARSPAGAGGYTTLSPRQQILPAPYAIQTRGIFVDENNNVGIGTTTPLNPLHVETDGFRAIYAKSTQSTSTAHGVYGQSDSTSGRGVFGLAAASTGLTYGGYFQSTSTSGRGVFGWAFANTGTTFGGRFRSDSTSGLGVFGEVTALSGINYGGWFESDSTSGRGVFGEAKAITGTTYGVYGKNHSTDGRGVYGEALASTGINYGGFFQSNSTSGSGVFGIALATSGITYGGKFESQSTTGRGVFGLASRTTGINYGGWFESVSPTGRGVFGFANANSGVNFGVVGHSNSSSDFDFWASGAGTNYGAPSSRRWKSNVVPIGDPLAKLAKLQGVYFDWDDEHGGQHDVGMIAEEVGEVLPEIVNYEENGVDAIGMDYSKMTPLLVEAVNAMRAEKDEQIESLRAEKDAQISNLELRIGELESLFEQLAQSRIADRR